MKILLVTAFLISGLTWAQEHCLGKETLKEQISCLISRVEDSNLQSVEKKDLIQFLNKKIDKDSFESILLDLSNPEVVDEKKAQLMQRFKQNANKLAKRNVDADIFTLSLKFRELQDSRTPKITLPRNIKTGDFIRLEILDINTFKYKVEVTNSDIDNSSDLPSSLISNLGIDALSPLVSNLNSASEIFGGLLKQNEGDSSEEAVAEEIIQATGEQIMVAAKSTKLNTTKKQLEKEKEVEKELKEALDKLFNKHFELGKDFLETLKTKQEGINNVYLAVEDKGNLVQEVFKTTEDIKADQNISYCINQYPNEQWRCTATGILDAFKIHKKDMIDIKADILKNDVTLKGKLESKGFKDFLVKKENSELNAKIVSLGGVYEALLKAVDDMNQQLSAEKYAEISVALYEFKSHEKYKYVSLPFQHIQEQNKIDISITPRGDNSTLPSFSSSILIPNYEKSFWGFSSGIYLTKNQEENFSVEEITDSETGEITYNLIRENQSSEELGINTMIRYGRNLGLKKPRKLFWQFGFGAGLTINENIKPRLLVGTGLAYGEKNKLILDFGGIFMFYDKKSNVFALEGNQIRPENFLVGATQLRGYISLGYLIKLDKSE